MFSFIATVLYFDGSDFYLFAFILTIFTILNIRIGFKQYKLLNKITALNETFQTIYESSFDGIILFQNNRFKDCNNALVEMFGYSSKEELLQTHIKFTMPKYQDDGTLSIRKMLKIEQIAYKRGHYTFEWQHKKKNGEVFWVECALTKVYINDEEILHGVYRDINKRKELEKEKEQFQATLLKQVEIEVEKNRKKDKMIMYQSRLAQMGEMINMIAHQWRQPLNAITIATGAIHLKATRGTLDNQKAIEISNNITKFALHLSSTIDDFRNFFKTNKEMQKTTYNQLVTNVLVIIESSLKNHDIKLELEIQELIELTIYENEMKQVLLNLIKNAEDALIERAITNPTIKIFIDKRKLIVSDNAGGIHEDIIEKIFDPYFSTKMKKDGTGLGLYMSKIIIEDHCNGQLSVQNTKDGASFMILLGEEND
jgi:PAS domain S-box-containing protein